jgi:hypothetical protein
VVTTLTVRASRSFPSVTDRQVLPTGARVRGDAGVATALHTQLETVAA